MIGNLNTALRTLKDAIARDPGAVPVLTREAIETEFHGLNVSQIARLVDAPALGCAETRRSERGATVELLMVDGADARLKAETLRRALIERAAPAQPGDLQEYALLELGQVRDAWLRDHNDVVYRLNGRQAVIDQELTAAVRSARQRAAQATPVEDALPGYHRPIVIRDPIAVSAAVGRVLQLVGELHARNQQAFGVIRLLMQATAQAEAPAAGEVAAPDQLKGYGLQLLETAQQSEAALAALQQGVDAVIAMLNEAEPLHPHMPQ